MISERIRADDGRSVELWINEPAPDLINRGAVVIASAFGRRMHHYSTLAAHLVANGIISVRYDPLDHVGLSDGEIYNYTLSSGLCSLELAVRTAIERYPGINVGTISSSLSAPLAYRQAAGNPEIKFLATISGVCDVRYTLERVFSLDYTVVPRSDLPDGVEFEGHRIDIASFQDDGRAQTWWGLNTTRDALKKCHAEITCYHGEHDSWVAVADLEKCAASALKKMDIVRLAGTTHEVDRNLPIARYVARDIVSRACLTLAGEVVEPIVPSHKELLSAALIERRLQRANR